jgi:hypothetical protein
VHKINLGGVLERYDLDDTGMVEFSNGTFIYYEEVSDLVTDLLIDMAAGRRKPNEELAKRLKEFYNE